MEQRPKNINIPSTSDTEAVVLAQLLQKLVNNLGHAKLCGLLKNQDEIMNNFFVQQKLKSYAKQ